MLLKVGLAMMLVSLMLAAGVAVAVVGFRSGEAPIETAAVSSVEPSATETTEEEEKFDPGQKLEIDDEPVEKARPNPSPPPVPDDVPDTKPAPEPRPKAVPRREKLQPRPDPTPLLAATEWPQPTNQEVEAAAEPRYFAPAPGAEMTLTIAALGLYEVPVYSSSEVLEALDASLLHVPETSFPWDGGAQRNVYISGHYLGWPGTSSRLVFYNLDKLRGGEEVVLEDRGGRAYRYRVTESFAAGPEESWVMGQEVGRDMVTLQTCIPPTFEERLIVQADRA